MSKLFELIPGLRHLNDMELEELHEYERLMRDEAIPAILRAQRERQRLAEEARRRLSEAIPVDRSATTLADGSPVTPDHRELKENGQQKDYVVLSAEERAKGYVRPVRRTYRHVKCGSDTSMSQAIAETYARDPKFYSGTFCVQCGKHFLLMEGGKHQFEWVDDGSPVGS